MGCRISKPSAKEEPTPRSFRVISYPETEKSSAAPTPLSKRNISRPIAVPFSTFVHQVGVPDAIPSVPGAYPTSPPPFSQNTLTASQPPPRTTSTVQQPPRPKASSLPLTPPQPLQSHPTPPPPHPILLHRSSLPSLIPIPTPLSHTPTSPPTPSPLRTIVFPPLPYVPPGSSLEEVLASKGKRRLSSLREPGRVLTAKEKQRLQKAQEKLLRKERGGRGNKGVSREVKEANAGWSEQRSRRAN
ncbi:MAG: hypothetical protein Q9209_007325 [Squamulea sp. 1 TL-2023]